MNRGEIARYFRILAGIYRRPCTIILTGAAAGTFYGNIRATLDLDFAIRFKARSKKKRESAWQEFAGCAQEVSLRTGIAAQYAEDIDRWSSITYLDYQNHTIRYRRFGLIEVRLLDPCYWAIGKMTRYLDPDIRDLIEVLKKTRTPPAKLARVLGMALRKSPKSTACELFRRQTEDFFRSYGPRIWGRQFSSKRILAVFNRNYRL